MHTLNSRNRRVDVDIGNEANYFFISGGSSKAALGDNLAEACKSNKLIVVQNDLDDMLVARVVLGQLNKQEEIEWVESGKRFLELPDGELIVCDGREYVDRENTPQYIDSLEGESWDRFQIKPGKYLVTVYTHLPSINVLSPKMGKKWPGLIRYFQATRPRKKIPEWMVEAAESGEDTDAIIESDKFDERYEDVEPINFVIQIQPAKSGDRGSSLTDGCELKMRRRLPARCPLGIIPKLARTTSLPKAVAKPEVVKKSERPRVKDEAKVIQTYRSFAEHLNAKVYETASRYFVPSLRQGIVDHLETYSERLKPVTRVWLDEEEYDDAIPCWQNGQGNRRQLCDAELLKDSNYLGRIRCQFGHSNSKRYNIVDGALIQSDEGPQLAGIVFWSLIK